MPWSISRMARYVQQCKYLQQLKENEEVCNKAFERGSYLMYCTDRPFLSLPKKESKNPFRTELVWKSFKEVEPFNPGVKQSSVVLGVRDEDDMTPLFACPIPLEEEEKAQSMYEGRFTDMRRALFTLSDESHQIACRGYSMLTWDASVRFCSNCGSELLRKVSGCSKDCSKSCPKKTHYPQIHPVAITRVVNPTGDKILLVRQPHFPPGMYSCIAGFMEPGETLNDNIRREIAEEAGIVVEKIEYFQSEAWPLPQASLMMGCTAVAMPGSEQTDIDKEELEDAKWFTKEEVGEAIKRVKKNPNAFRDNEKGELLVPPHGAIAHQLIRNWLEQYTPSKL